MAKNPYNEYLKRSKVVAQGDPYYAQAKQRLATMARPLQQMQQQMANVLQRSGMSAAAQSEMMTSSQQQQMSLMGDTAREYETNVALRRDEQRQRLNEIQFQKEQYDEKIKEEKERQKDEWKKGLIQTGLTIGGMALGGGVGALIGGSAGSVATKSGMSLGASIGGATAGIVTQDPAMLSQSVAYGATELGNALTIPAQAKATKAIASNINKLDTNQLIRLKLLMGSGDWESINAMLEGEE